MPNPTVKPIDDAVERAYSVLFPQVECGRIPGAVLGAVDRDGNRSVRACGWAQVEPQARPMHEGTWFDLASLTKVIYTSPRILTVLEQEHIGLDEPLTRLLPDLRQYDPGAWERRVTFSECLSHQTPFPAVEPIYTYGQDPELLRAFVLQRQWMPKTSPSVYSDINFMLLGFALERHYGCRLWDTPAGEGFAFSAPPAQCAATEVCTWRRRLICGEVHDDNCSALQGAGHAGLFGTAEAVLNFAHGLLCGKGVSTTVLQQMRTPVSEQRTLGWECAHAGWSGGEHCSDSSIGHTGFTGTGLWIDFAKGRAWTLLSNRIHPTRHSDSGIVALRKAVSDAINRVNE